MPDVFILSACRTPIGKFHGTLSSLPVTQLGAVAVREAVARTRLDPAEIDEVILGNVLTAGVGQAPARQAALQAGLSPEVPALTINKVCGSGLKAVMLATQAIHCGDAELIVAGGMESMSQAGWVLPREEATPGNRTLLDSMMHDGLTCAFSHQSMGKIAEDLAARSGISRNQQDNYALQSQHRAMAAQESGVFEQEIIPVSLASKELNIVRDEGPRSDTDLARLGNLPPVFQYEGTVTAGNSSLISDGAAAVIVASERAISRSAQKPLARIVAMATSGTKPEDLFVAPVEAIRRVVKKAGRSLDDIDLFEINEAFAVQMLACLQQLELPQDRVNVHGGAIALGHPIGASGARILVTLIHALQQRDLYSGVAALCLGGGNAVAMLLERMKPEQ